MKNKLFLTLLMGLFIVSCSEEEFFVPKPRGYARIDLQKDRKFQQQEFNCGFKAEIPSYARIEKKSGSQKCAENIMVDNHKAEVWLTYYPVDSLDLLFKDAYNSLDKENVRASRFKDSVINNKDNNVYGFAYELEGDAGCNFQFFVTDSVNHFLRGSLHFYTRPNYDSLYPVINHMREDIYHLVQTLEWSDKPVK